MKKNLSFATLVLSAILISSACLAFPSQELDQPLVEESVSLAATEQPTLEVLSTEIQIVDDLGIEITLAAPAQKIISISPSLTEILFSIGAGDRLIGRDSNSNYPAEALEAIDLGGMWEGIPIEDLLALQPDLILAGEIYSAEAVAELRDLGLVVYWQANPESFEDLYQNILDISVLTGTETAAHAGVESLSLRVETLRDLLQQASSNPLVYYELDASDPANPWTTGAGTFISYVISQAKGQNLGDSLAGDWVQISSEELIAQDPEFILLADALYGITPESVSERAGWEGIRAVASGNIYPFDPFILSVPGPRLVNGFEQLAEILHPELYP